ncbi:MAG: hypothetical protein OSJ53_15445, partial [Kineothrix sp.]|nr:hypothetical protein [Kineothrix sp.]
MPEYIRKCPAPAVKRHGNQFWKSGAWQGGFWHHRQHRAEAGQDRLPMDFYCFVKGNEIFL